MFFLLLSKAIVHRKSLSNCRNKRILNKNTIFAHLIFLSTLLTYTLSVNKVIANTHRESQPQTTLFNIKLQTELLAMQRSIVELQQKKKAYTNEKLPLKLIKNITTANEKNGLRLLELTKKHGWPKTSLVGIKANDAAFIIMQQAEHSIQKYLLPTLENEFKQGLLSGQKLATLIDIMLIKSGEKQRYGTQLAIINGQIVFNDIADKKNLEQRRQALNMLPMAQYKLLLKKMYKLD